MGNVPSQSHKSPLVVVMDGKSAVISRHTAYEDAVTAVKAVKTFKDTLDNHDIYFTAFLPKLGEAEFEVTEDAWQQVLPLLAVLNVHVTGEDKVERQQRAPAYELHKIDEKLVKIDD